MDWVAQASAGEWKARMKALCLARMMTRKKCAERAAAADLQAAAIGQERPVRARA
jgi:hypothetical protein